ncbi:MAG: hypothetical protein A2174_03385 [Candidatus Portnoybacteria bacterium RBG_13_41_18]|uniref:Uncharacterized protein n=1 Tax=Candidatus Portnoybacteria bacterium RBG_13_41_18 TaxID=1801991 RepID=A0A1G2F4J9_9BACT|nr:MAG: hypothetical protein A2174_03385 [Candidatus Portnoybacteria bacterium RBG_13_41_18]
MSEFISSTLAPKGPLAISKFSAIGVVLAIILAIVLILLGERLIFDLNRWINPLIQEQYSYGGGVQMGDMYNYGKSTGLSVERNALAPDTYVYYPTVDRGSYLAYKLLIHAGFILPIFLLVFLLYYAVKIKEQKQGWQAVIYAFMVFAFWMILHLLGETVSFISSQYKSAAIYIILGALVVVVMPLAIFLQKKHNEKAVQ